MKKHIRLSKSCLSSEEKESVLAVLDKEYLGMGDEVNLFEKALTDYLGREVICVANGTAALHLALESLDLESNDEVLVPSLTYLASFQAISAAGLKPVACDIELDNLTIDWRDAQKRITKRTKAIMPVHYTGGVGELDELYEFAFQHGLRVIEDAAHAFGTFYKGRKIGGFGDVACFSFDGIKNITSGEGGCIVTSDELILQRCKDARLLGVEKDTIRRYSGQRSWNFDVKRQGWRYHMSNIMAAIGIVQLGRLSEFAQQRQRNALLYDRLLSENPEIFLLKHDYSNVVPHIYVVRIDNLDNRESLREKLKADGIETGVHYQPNHQLSLYQDIKALPLTVTDKVSTELLSLPLHPEVTEDDISYVCEKLFKHMVR